MRKMPNGTYFYTVAELKNILNVKDLTLGAYGIFVKGKIKYSNNEVDKK